MFLQRMLTSLILGPLVLLIIFYGAPWLLTGIVLFVFLVAGKECFQLIPLKKVSLQIAFIAAMLFCLWACGYLYTYWLGLGLILWGLNICAVLTFPKSQAYWGYPVVVSIVFLVLIPLFIQSLIHLYYLPEGKTLLVYLLFLIWASDIGAYLTGKLIGAHKLIPKVSPGKYWEGVLGGVILAMMIAWAGAVYFVTGARSYLFFLSCYTVISSIFC
jgi:phosphatidate cytidylyltransferase